MKLVCISDTHGKHDQVEVPDGDVLIHAGDWTHFGQGWEEFAEWFYQLPHNDKIIIRGNHENKGIPPEATGYMDGYFHYLSVGKEHVEIDGVTFATPKEASNVDPDVVISHVPPAGVLGGSGPGASSLRDDLKFINYDLHICGHIHKGYGRTTQGETEFVNCSVVVAGQVQNPPITVDYEPEPIEEDDMTQ